jgi:hypothetical protein
MARKVMQISPAQWWDLQMVHSFLRSADKEKRQENARHTMIVWSYL